MYVYSYVFALQVTINEVFSRISLLDLLQVLVADSDDDPAGIISETLAEEPEDDIDTVAQMQGLKVKLMPIIFLQCQIACLKFHYPIFNIF